MNDKSFEPIAEHLEATEHEWPLPCTLRQLRRDRPDLASRPAVQYPLIDLASVTRPAPRRLDWRSYYYTGAAPGEWSTESATSRCLVHHAGRSQTYLLVSGFALRPPPVPTQHHHPLESPLESYLPPRPAAPAERWDQMLKSTRRARLTHDRLSRR